MVRRLMARPGERDGARTSAFDRRNRWAAPTIHCLVNAGYGAYLIDQASGAKLTPPALPRAGRSRLWGSVVRPRPDGTYYVLFANLRRSIQPGRKVTVVVGDFKAPDLTVQ